MIWVHVLCRESRFDEVERMLPAVLYAVCLFEPKSDPSDRRREDALRLVAVKTLVSQIFRFSLFQFETPGSEPGQAHGKYRPSQLQITVLIADFRRALINKLCLLADQRLQNQLEIAD